MSICVLFSGGRDAAYSSSKAMAFLRTLWGQMRSFIGRLLWLRFVMEFSYLVHEGCFLGGAIVLQLLLFVLGVLG